MMDGLFDQLHRRTFWELEEALAWYEAAPRCQCLDCPAMRAAIGPELPTNEELEAAPPRDHE